MNASAQPPTQVMPLSRNALIAIAVVLLHVGFIWALQSGLVMRAAELIVPVEILTQFIEPPLPKVTPAPKVTPVQPQPKPPVPVKQVIPKAPQVQAQKPLATVDSTPSANSPTGVTTPQPNPAPVAADIVVAPLAPATPPVIQLPSSDANYLLNPTPPYPPISRRMGEQGKTTVRVLIGADGQPQRAEIAKSSGFDRLDQAAIAAVMRWRYVPGKRNGTPETMWFNVPINWVLE